MGAKTWIIGSAAECDPRVDCATVSGRHCRLTKEADGFLLEDLGSSNGTFVNGQRVERPRVVRHGDLVTLGRSTPMPWPATASITVGRLPDNDIVISADVISGHHARVERDGGQVFVVDLNSSNGTAVGDPLKKIQRAAIHHGDMVFLGTHRIPAVQLLAALPEEQPRATALESTHPFGVASAAAAGPPTSEPVPAGAQARARSIADQWQSSRSWAWGVGLSAACLAIFAAGFWSFAGRLRGNYGNDQAGRDTVTGVAAANLPPGDQYHDQTSDQHPSGQVVHSTGATLQPPPRPANTQAPFDEQAIRRAESGVFLIAVRTDRLLVFTHSTAWAVSADRLICPTSILEQIDRKLTTGDKLDDCIVGANPEQTIRALSHSPVPGYPSVSLAQLEGQAKAVCPVGDGPALAPSQQLGLLVADGKRVADQPDDAKSISRRLIMVKIDQLQRDNTGAVAAAYCTAADEPGPAAGAPLFNGAGQVIAFVDSVDKSEIRAIPLSRLTPLVASERQ